MKALVNQYIYDTEKAEEVFTTSDEDAGKDETLYRTKNGRWFVTEFFYCAPEDKETNIRALADENAAREWLLKQARLNKTGALSTLEERFPQFCEQSFEEA
jgi:hypothetical protein